MLKRPFLNCILVLSTLISTPSYAQLSADFSSTSATGCAPLVVTFFDGTTGGTPTSWQWNLGNSATPTIANPTTTYTIPGTYSVTLTAANASGSNSVTKTNYITVYGAPGISFSASPTAGCLPLNVQFSASITPNAPGNLIYTWDFGDGTANSNDPSPQHTYTSAGSFTVTLTVENGAGCVASYSSTTAITVYAPPVSSISVNQIDFCSPPDTAIFTNNSSGSGPFTTSWNFGDVTTGTGSPVSHVYNSGGAYLVTMTSTDSKGCSTIAAPVVVSLYGTIPSFTMQSAACVYDSVSFFNTTPNAVSSDWDFGNGLFSQEQNPRIPYITPGTYTVKLTTGIGPCQKTLTKTIVIHPRPVATVAYSPAVPCPGAPFTFYTIPSSASFTYAWDFGDGSNANGDTVSHTYTTLNHPHVVVATITNPATGCTSNVSDHQVINHKLGIDISPLPDNGGCIPFTANFATTLYTSSPVVPYPAPAATMAWTMVGGSPVNSTSFNPSSVWTTVGTYQVKVTGTTTNGCLFADSILMHPDTPVIPDFIASPLKACVNTPLTFTNITTGPFIGPFEWDLGDTVFRASKLPPKIKRYQEPGLYSIRLSTYNNGCIGELIKTDYVEIYPPNARFRDSIECPPSLTVHFNDISNGATSRLWDFGDGVTSTATNPVHIYAAAGTYPVLLTTYNSIYGCSDTEKRIIRVYPPNLSATASKRSICVDEVVHLDGLFSGASAAMGAWIFDNDSLTVYNYSGELDFSFADTGYHDAKFVTISGQHMNCYDTLDLPNYLFVSKPIARFTATPLVGCMPLQVSFVDSSHAVPGTTITSRVWDYGNKVHTPVSTLNTSYTYNTAGIDTVKLYVTDNLGCQDSLIRNAYIEVRNPVADFKVPKIVACAGEQLRMSNLSTATTSLSYLWDFGDGTTDTARQPLHAWANNGTYTIKLTITDPTPCSRTKAITNAITIVSPTAAFSMDKTLAVCPPLVVQFTNASTGASLYSWNFGTSSSPSGVFNPVHTYSKPGKFNIVLTAIDGFGCTDTAMQQAYVLGYNGAFTATPQDGCLPQPVQFSSLVTGIPKVTWDFNDGSVAVTTTTHSVGHTYTNSGTFRPIAIFSDGRNCNAVDSGSGPIRIDKIDADFSASSLCVGAAFTLSDVSGFLFEKPNNWQWLFSPADTATGMAVTHTFHTSGVHPVRLIATNAWGCRDTLIKDIYINALPLVDAGPADTGICPGDTIQLVGRGASTYSWGPDSLVSCINCAVTYVSKAAPTMYYLKGVDANGCINYDSIRAHIQIHTTSSVKPGGEICVGDTFRLGATGATLYSWEPHAFLDSPGIASPLAKPIITTTYVLTAKEGTCYERKDSVLVVVHPLPIFDAGPDEWINYGSAVTLQPKEKDIARIAWRNDTSLSCLDCFRPVARPAFSTFYYATAYSDFGCESTDSVLVQVRCNGDSVYIPNTFTPNADGKNDVFYPRGKGLLQLSSMRVFNRWGELVFERAQSFPLNDESYGWDGTFKGRQLAPDVYVYIMTTRCPSGEPLSFKGDINLVR